MRLLALHGAFRGGWAFTHLGRELALRGHEMSAPSLLGMGELAPAAERRPSLGLADWSRQVQRLVELEDLHDLVLLAHSQGGLVARACAPLLTDRLACVAYLDAPVPEPGERGVDLLGAPAVDLPPRDTWLEATPLVADEHHPERLVAWVNDRLCATPLGPSLDPMEDAPVAVPQHHAFCDHTPEGYPSGHQRRRLDSAGVAYSTLDAPHDAQLTDPAQVADWIESLPV